MTDKLTTTQKYENNIIIEQLNKQCGLTVNSIELVKGNIEIFVNELNCVLIASKREYGYTINDELGNHACIVSNDTMYPQNIITPSMEVFEVCCEKCQCYFECECEDNENKNEESTINKKYDKLQVEELETQCRMLAECFGEIETEDYFDEIEGVETFIYYSSTQYHIICVNYDYENNNFDVYITSTHDDIKCELRINSKTLSETYEQLRKRYNELSKMFLLADY